MGRPILSSDCDELQHFVEKRNIICSRNFLAALISNHGTAANDDQPQTEEPPAPDPEPSPTVLIPTNKIEQIKRSVCKKFGVSKQHIESASRKKGVVHPRQIGMYLARKHTTHSYPEIGRRFGGRDHTTILHAFEKIQALVKRDETVAAVVAELEAQIT